MKKQDLKESGQVVFSLSASMGVRDNNELSWTQVLNIIEFMSDSTTIPILLDGDTGYGNFNNMRRLVRKLEQIGIAGVCIEDKVFPKTNSFLRGQQPLADIDEFCGKIKAGKDSQSDEDFIIVARVEAFIAGHGLNTALNRAEKYRQAGADAILIHSKLSQPSEIFEFIKYWDNRFPIVIVPTKYYATPTSAFRDRKVSLVIWANHLLRGAVKKMQDISSNIYKEQSLHSVEDDIAQVNEIFRLQGDQELQAAEQRYLYTSRRLNKYSAIILAATKGDRLGNITEKIPKTMLKVGNKTILEKSVNNIRSIGIEDLNVIAGYKIETIKIPGVNIIENNDYSKTGQMSSLAKAINKLHNQSVILFGDIVYKKYILNLLLDDPHDFAIIVDHNVKQQKSTKKSDYIYSTTANHKASFEQAIYLKKIIFDSPNENYQGEWIGMLKLSKNGSQVVKKFIQQNEHHPDFKIFNKFCRLQPLFI